MRSSKRAWGIPFACLLGAVVSAPAAFAADRFVERTDAVGLDHEIISGLDRMNGHEYLYDWAQSGVALGDLDGDGDLDVVACGGLHPNSVFRNDGGTFVDITAAAGINAGEFDRVPALGDFDDDGDLDLWIGSLEAGSGPKAGRSRMYRNDGTGVFEEVTELAATLGSGHSLHAKWVDLDLDGLVDLYVSEFHATRNHYYRNNGDGTFTDVSLASGTAAEGSTHITGIVDSDLDGHFELMVGNDYLATENSGMAPNAADIVLSGGPDGTFTDVSEGSGLQQVRAIMGMTFGDVDYDGLMDVYKTDGGPNHLLINHGWPSSGLEHTTEATAYGVLGDEVPDPAQPGSFGVAIGWGAAFVDVDLDRWLDLVVVNGLVAGPTLENGFPRGQQNFLYKGAGPAGGFVFTDESQQSGLNDEFDDRGLAIGDLDDDGDVDLVIAPTSGTLRYYDNRIDELDRGWLQVRPLCRTSASGCVGTRIVRTDSAGRPHVRVLGTDAPTASQRDDSTAYFGLGPEATTDLSVAFPSGVTIELRDVAREQRISVEEPEMVSLPSRTVRRAGPQENKLYTVTTFAHDATGQPLGESAKVAIDVVGWTPDGPVRHVEANRFERTFRVPSVAGSHRVEVTFDGFGLRVRPTVHVVGAIDVDASELWIQPTGVRHASPDTFTVTVATKDVNGVSTGPGADISARVGTLEPIGGTVDLGDGRYQMEFPSPPEPGIFQVDVLFNGQVVGPGGQLQIEAAELAAEATTVVYEEIPWELHSAAPHQMKMVVTPRDAAGRRLGPDASLRVQVREDPGTPDVTFRSDLHQRGQRDGNFPVVLEKGLDQVGTLATGTVQIYVGLRLIGERRYAF